MARACTVCSHPDAVLINEAIVGVRGKGSNRSIAKQYDLDDSAVQRHKDHLPELLIKASEAEEITHADGILDRIEHLEHETLQLLEDEKASSEVDRRIILQAIREQRGNIELIAKVKQLIDLAPKTEIVLISPHVQALIIGALLPYPEARRAVADSLASLEAAS